MLAGFDGGESEAAAATSRSARDAELMARALNGGAAGGGGVGAKVIDARDGGATFGGVADVVSGWAGPTEKTNPWP